MPIAIHSPLVHFAIALFALSFILDGLGIINHNEKYNFAAQINLYASVPAVLAAVITGLIEKNRVFLPPAAQEVFEIHETLAFVITTLFVVLSLWRLNLKGPRWQETKRYYMVISFAALLLIFSGGYYGSQLVYRYGIGTTEISDSSKTTQGTTPDQSKNRDNLFYAKPDTGSQE